MALVNQLAAQPNAPSEGISESLSSGVKAGVQLATAKEQVESAKTKLDEQRLELDQKKFQAFDGMIKTLNRTNPAYAKTLAKTMKNKFQQYGFDPAIVDVVVSDPNFGRVYQNLSDAMSGKILNNRQALADFLSSAQDAGLLVEGVNILENSFKRSQQDKQFAIQMAKVDQSQEKSDKAQAKQDERLARQEAQALSKRLEADSLPEVVNSIKQIDEEVGGLYSEDASKKFDKIAGSKGFWASVKIPFTEIAPLESTLISSSDKPLYQAVASLRNNYLKLRSGGAVTSPEADRFLQELGQGNIRSGKDLQSGIQLLTKALESKVKTIEAGYMPESVELLSSRGNPVSSASFPKAEGGKKSVITPDQKLIEFQAFLDRKGLTPEQKQKALEQYKSKQASTKDM